jgi:hypothetical protein
VFKLPIRPESENCVFDIPAETVDKNWVKTMPPLQAKFVPICEAAPADSFAAIQNVIFNGKGCAIGKSPRQIALDSGNEHSVMAKCGESAGTGRLDKKFSGTGIADIIGGLLIYWLGV